MGHTALIRNKRLRGKKDDSHQGGDNRIEVVSSRLSSVRAERAWYSDRRELDQSCAVTLRQSREERDMDR
jgi:hypothetical protein